MSPRRLGFLLPVLATGIGLSLASDRPDVALSASYMPPQFIIPDPEQRERVRAHLRSLAPGEDTTRQYEMRGRSLQLSHALEERLAREESHEGRDVRRRARARLERLFGSGIELDDPLFLQGYLPENIGFTHRDGRNDYPQWPLHNDGSLGSAVAGTDINIAPVWERFDGADSLVIAVVDAGFNFLHPALQGRWYENPGETGMTQPGGLCWTGTPVDKRFNECDDDGNGYVDDWRGWNFVEDNNNTQDYHGHGTQVSALLVAPFDTSSGMTGMLPRARILPVRALNTSGFGSTNDIAAAIRYAARMGAHAVNFSIGISGAGESQALRSAFMEARDSGMIVAAAAGNNSRNLDVIPTQPGSYGFENVYTIASHGPSGAVSGFSNYGASTVDLAAPGQAIVTASIPPPITLVAESFVGGLSDAWTVSPEGSFVVSVDSIEGPMSLQWVNDNGSFAERRDIDLRGRRGGQMSFRVFFQQGGPSDRLRVSVIPEGGSERIVADIPGADSVRYLTYSLGSLEGTRFNLRFRACLRLSNNNCSTSGTLESRVVRIADLRIRYADENPENHNVHVVTGGTSMAAPFFAGYAGLMRIASDRAGVPLTRERMLAGTTPVPALRNRVITGSRLDVARGLDFYLQTLPHLEFTDDAVLQWDPGNHIQYAFFVRDTDSSTLGGYDFSLLSGPDGGWLSDDGLFAWSSAGAADGYFTLRVRADSPDHTLRKMVPFTLGNPAAIPQPAVAGMDPILRVGNRGFLLPEQILNREHNVIRIEVFGADGRLQERFQGMLHVSAGARSAEYQLQGLPGVGMRVWVNGVPLKAAR